MDPETLLVTTVARHFPEAKVAGNVVDVGFVQLACKLGVVQPFGGMHSAQLLFDVTGDELGGPVQLSMTSYGSSVAEAIVSGACGWTCSFGPVLRAGLSDEAVENVDRFVVMQNGVPFRVYVDGYDHVLHFEPTGGESAASARDRLAGGVRLAFQALGTGAIALDPDRPQLLGIFVGELPGRRVVEVKLDGVVQGNFDGLVARAQAAPVKQMVALREVSIVVPD